MFAAVLLRLPYNSAVDPDRYIFEPPLAGLIPLVGEDRFFWASDSSHPDHPPSYVKELTELVSMLPESTRPKLMGDNVRGAAETGRAT